MSSGRSRTPPCPDPSEARRSTARPSSSTGWSSPDRWTRWARCSPSTRPPGTCSGSSRAAAPYTGARPSRTASCTGAAATRRAGWASARRARSSTPSPSRSSPRYPEKSIAAPSIVRRALLYPRADLHQIGLGEDPAGVGHRRAAGGVRQLLIEEARARIARIHALHPGLRAHWAARGHVHELLRIRLILADRERHDAEADVTERDCALRREDLVPHRRVCGRVRTRHLVPVDGGARVGRRGVGRGLGGGGTGEKGGGAHEAHEANAGPGPWTQGTTVHEGPRV